MEENGNYGDVPGLYPNLLSQELKKACKRAKQLKVELHFPKEAIREKEENLEQEQKRLHAQHGLGEEEELSVRHDTNLLFDRQRIAREAETESIHRCKGICDVFSGQLYCTLDGRLAVCCVDGYHYTEELKKASSIKEYWQAPSVQMIRDCFQKKKLPSICNNCNFIILDQLKYLDVLDRKTYLETVNRKEKQSE